MTQEWTQHTGTPGRALDRRRGAMSSEIVGAIVVISILLTISAAAVASLFSTSQATRFATAVQELGTNVRQEYVTSGNYDDISIAALNDLDAIPSAFTVADPPTAVTTSYGNVYVWPGRYTSRATGGETGVTDPDATTYFSLVFTELPENACVELAKVLIAQGGSGSTVYFVGIDGGGTPGNWGPEGSDVISSVTPSDIAGSCDGSDNDVYVSYR